MRIGDGAGADGGEGAGRGGLGPGEDASGAGGSMTGIIPPGIVSARRLPMLGAMPIAAAASCPTWTTGRRAGPGVISNGDGS